VNSVGAVLKQDVTEVDEGEFGEDRAPGAIHRLASAIHLAAQHSSWSSRSR
jgi:hypothetical protein